jgi:hypothetical protein
MTQEYSEPMDQEKLVERVHALEVAQASQTATQAGSVATLTATQTGAAATTAASQAGMAAAVSAGAAGLIAGIFVGIALSRAPKS